MVVCKHARALAKVILCMRNVLAGSLRISGVCSHGHLLGLTSLFLRRFTPEKFHARALTPQVLCTRGPLAPAIVYRNALPEKLETCCRGFVLPSAHMKYIKDNHQTHHIDDGVLFQCTRVPSVVAQMDISFLIGRHQTKCLYKTWETLPPSTCRCWSTNHQP